MKDVIRLYRRAETERDPVHGYNQHSEYYPFYIIHYSLRV